METPGLVIKTIKSGLPQLDELLQGLLPGDNVVWQVDRLEDYPYFAQTLADQAISDGFECVYLSFAAHSSILKPRPGLEIIRIDPSPGFDYFSGEVHRIIEKRSGRVFYIFDNLSDLVDEWATDELLANFFQVTCPYLFQVGAVAYFALRRGQHGHSAIARIRETTQILVDVYHVGGNTYIQPLKVWERYSQQMFLPHLINPEGWESVSRSGDAARLLTTAVKAPLSTSYESIAPWDSVYRRLLRNREEITDNSNLTQETFELKEALSRMMIGNHKKLVQLSEHYLTLADLLAVRNRLIGSGRIGGKAAGMILARNVLLKEKGKTDFSQVLEEHDSFYIGADVFFTFLVNNDLFGIRLELSKTGRITRDEFAELELKFLTGKFPEETMEQFRGMIDYYGQAPIIVRSSSLLEDGFTDAFAGKYRSEFCANQGSPEERLEAVLRAIKLVYASALNPDALAYRHRRGMTEGDEQMAILVQRVSGTPYKQFFFPGLAGVAFSRNLYAWTDRIDPGKGMIRLVFGLGTRAVNRVGGDYIRMIAVSHPTLRPEIGAEIAKYSQRLVDVINLQENVFQTLPFNDVIASNNFPSLNLMVSNMADGYPRDWSLPAETGLVKNPVLTFNDLIGRTALVNTIGELLAKLETAWGQPVDIEFTAYVDNENNIKVNLLQCRTLRLPAFTEQTVSIPAKLPKEQILFHSYRAVNAGLVSDIGYIIYIDPRQYALTSLERKRTLGRIIGQLNHRFHDSKHQVMMMGPGRWGSSNIELGVNVGYADIDGTAILAEVAFEKAGHTPEVSYGTHFFQDLVESGILYLPVYPDEANADFNNKFFSQSPNILKDLLPDLSDYADIVHVIDVPAATSGATAKVVVDLHTRHAICFLERSSESQKNNKKRGKEK